MTDTDFRVFQQTEDRPDAQVARWQSMRASMHRFYDEQLKDNPAEAARLKTEWDRQHDASFAASGLTTPAPKTPEQVAEDRLERQFAVPAIGDELAASLETELERIAALPHEHARMAVELARHYGSPEAYQRRIEEAKAGMNGSVEWSPAMSLSRHFLDVVSVYGRANRAYDAAIAARGGSR